MSEKERDVKREAQVKETAPARAPRSISDGGDRSSEHHGHRSHHHSHHHHSHHHHTSTSSRRSKTLKQFFSNNRKKLFVICAAVLFCACSVLAGTFMDHIFSLKENYGGNSDFGEKVDVGMIGISVSVFDKPVSLVNPAVQVLLGASAETNASDIYTQYNGASIRLDTGAPVKLSYRISNVSNDYMVDTAVFTLSEHPDMSNPICQNAPQGQATVEFANLKTGTAYYYRLDVTFVNGVTSAVLGDFTTAQGPRMMTVDGGYNIRDVGGWLVSGNKRIKQGLLFRGGEIDGAVEPLHRLTETGKSVMLTQLNIKTDMDLRNKADTPNGTDVLGANVKHVYYGAPTYSDALMTDHNAAVRSVFADLANPAQYPAYLHCTYGLDRTGTMCYLLGALLGMDPDDLLKDYHLSAMSQGSVDAELMDLFVQHVNELPGLTLSEKVETYLLNIGVTPAQIQSIRDIFLEDVQ